MDTNPKYSGNVRRLSALSARRQKALSQSSATSRSPSNKQDIRPLDDDGHVKVAVRCRPMSDKELSAGYESIVEFESSQRIVVHDVSEQPSDQLGTKSGERKNISHVYDFDHVFDCQSTQQNVYDQVCRPIVDSVLEGYNGTIFAYGQTGTGKTYTMEGLSNQLHRSSHQQRRGSKTSEISRKNSAKDTNNHQQQNEKSDAGIIPRAFEQIFEHVQINPEIQFLIRASYLEVYQEDIRDLLSKDTKNKLELHERSDIGVYVKDLTSFVCKSIGEIERVMRVGNQNRTVGATDMNEHSSRSHAIFMITIEQQQQHLVTMLKQEESENTDMLKGHQNEISERSKRANACESVIKVGKLNLVDLAGSECQRKTNSFGQRQKESIKINLSLSALGNVINSLMKLQQQREQQQQVVYDDSSKPANQALIHTPYRDSKLTRLLQDSLGGNAKTLMIANIGPASYNYDETINTLNYASRARCIKNRPRLNEDPKDALLRQLQKEIELLRAKLETQIGSNGGVSLEYNTTLASDNQSSGVSSAKSSRGSSGATTSDSNTVQTNRFSVSSMSNYSDEENNNNKHLLVEREFFELKQKLSSLESKLLNGDKFNEMALGNTPTAKRSLDHQSILKGLTEKQRLELERRQEELADQVSRERTIRNELERREEAELLAKQSFESVQQEVEAKRRLIWQVLLKVKSIRDELGSMQQAYRIELDELEQLQLVLQRELKLKCLIMDNFIPNEHVDQLIARVNYDERRNLCSIKPLELASSNQGGCLRTDDKGAKFRDSLFEYLHHLLIATNSTRPRSELERLSETINPSNIRYKSENLIEPSLVFIDPKQTRGAESNLRSLSSTYLKARRLCDVLGEQTDPATIKPASGVGSVQYGGNKNLDDALQAMINAALSQREPDLVI